MKIGTMVSLNENVAEKIRDVKKYGLQSFQLVCWNMEMFTDENAETVRQTADECGLELTALWCGWEGEAVWNFMDGYHTLGLVPVRYRVKRVENLKKGSDFAKKLGVTDVITHMGFLPENPETDEYREVTLAIREVAEYCKRNGQYLLFETGQETPITLLRTIEYVGTGNLGINLDPANLLLYGKANPCDAVDIFGKYVRGVHGKDGEYPTDPRYLGEEKRIGDGRVGFKLLISKLKACGYDGSITIEREIGGEKQIEDIIYAKKFLEDIING
ncbi:MAG: sugar phosphate isomerase/epimerase family protein [Christensenellales bacterium]|jgi:hypothetical protein